MLKRLISFVSAVMMFATVLSGFEVSAGASNEYVDVDRTHWAYTYIKRCSDTQWFSGYPDGTFHPEGSITRAEALKVFVTFLGLPLETVKESSYYDVSATAWYAPYIEAGKDLFPKRTALDGQAKFQPEMPVTREDVMYAIVVALGYDSEMEFVDQSILNMYSDVESITTSVRPYIAKVTWMGIVDGGDGNTISAQDPLTRAQFAKLLAMASEYGPNEGSGKKVISKIEVYPRLIEEMLVGDSFEVMAKVYYSDGTSEDYSDKTNPYTEDRNGIININKRKITAVKEGTVVVEFNNEELTDIQLVVIVKDISDGPSIRITDYNNNTTESTATIKGVVTDTSGSSISLTCNGKGLMINGDGSFSLPVDLSVGVNTFEFKAVNGSGKKGTQIVDIKRSEPTPEPTEKPTPKPTEKPEDEPIETPTVEPEPVYADDDPVQFIAEITKLPTETDRTVVVSVSYSGLTAAKVTAAEFKLGMDTDIYTYKTSDSSVLSGADIGYNKPDKAMRYSYLDSSGCTDTSKVLAEIAFEVSEDYDLEDVDIHDFELRSVSLKNGTAAYDSSNISIYLK